jgi:hypothetical protein
MECGETFAYILGGSADWLALPLAPALADFEAAFLDLDFFVLIGVLQWCLRVLSTCEVDL